MNLWMDILRDLPHVMDNHERLFDAWQEGGVDGLVIGPMEFVSADPMPGDRFVTGNLIPGTQLIDRNFVATAAYDPNPTVYERLGVEAPPPPDEPLPELRAQLEKTLQAAKDRGLHIMLMYAGSGAGPGGDGHHLRDERSLNAHLARMIDALEHFPMADGAIMDGPEWGYEIAPHHMDHRSFIFHNLPENVAPLCADLGYDYQALVAAKDRLYERLHNLDPRQVRLHGGGGLLGSFQLFGADPDLTAWLQFRVDSVTGFFRRFREALTAEMSRSVKLGVGPRSAAFAPLCGYDLAQMGDFIDVLLPKHYFWHRGFDGFVGTVFRWVETLCDWNPKLSEAEALTVVEALFGITLPGIAGLSDFESALSPEFYEQIVTLETSRALAAVDDPNRIVPWLDTGRFPHDGDPMTAADLRHLLRAAGDAGLERFLYHHQGCLSEGEWVVISEICGHPWRALGSDYRPSDKLSL
ncbi:MAG: hypothetical protein VCE12_04260 [Candidatus Latescibacterota bacterium]